MELELFLSDVQVCVDMCSDCVVFVEIHAWVNIRKNINLFYVDSRLDTAGKA